MCPAPPGSYQGEHQLAVTGIVKLGDGEAVTPREVTSTQVNDGSVLGQLITLKGYVVGIEMANGLVQTILVRDSAGVVSRVFIDGYICPNDEVKNLEPGCEISATGLASYDNTFVLADGTGYGAPYPHQQPCRHRLHRPRPPVR